MMLSSSVRSFVFHLLAALLLMGCKQSKPEPSPAAAASSAPQAQAASASAAAPASSTPPAAASASKPVEVTCPKVGYPCEDGYACTCFKNAAGQIVRHESKNKAGEVRAVMSYSYDAGGLLVRTDEDGGIWDKKSKVDGKADTTWIYTYDAGKNRTQHEVLDAAGKRQKLCTYKACPPPYAPDVCYTDLTCK